MADLLKALIQEQDKCQDAARSNGAIASMLVHRVSVSTLLAVTRITSTVRSRLSNYLEGVFPGKGITISCAAGKLAIGYMCIYRKAGLF